MTTNYATLAGRILLLMACINHWVVAAPPCDGRLVPDSDTLTGYRLREPNTRCEGFYKAPVSAAATLELVALTRGRLRFDSSANDILTLSSPIRHEAVQLRGIALPDKTYYRLDGLIPAAGGFRWVLSDAVRPRHLRPENLSLYGRLANKPAVYVPITVGPEPELSLRVRDPNSYDKVMWRYAQRSNDNCAAMPAWTAVRLPVHRMTGDPVDIPLPDKLTGQICLEVATLPKAKPSGTYRNAGSSVSGIDMNDAEQQRLKQAIQQESTAAAKALLIDCDTRRAQAHLAWIETAQHLLPAERTGVWRQLGPVLAVAGLCLFLAALATSLNPPSNPVRLDVEAEGIGFKLTKPWTLESAWPVTRIDAREISSVNTSQHGDRKAQQFRVKASSASLEKWLISAGAVLELESTEEGWRLFLSQGSIDGDIDVGKGFLQVDGGADEALQSKPGRPQEVLRFSGNRNSQDAVPLQIDIAGKPANGKLAELAVTDLHFNREVGKGTGQWISTLISAKGKFQHQEDAFELAEGDELQLVDAQSQRCSLIREGGHIKMLFHGAVGRLRGGPQGYVEDLTPTWLDVFTHHKKILGLWAAVVFLWPLAIWFRGLKSSG